MHVAIAIVGYANAQDIARCLAALEHLTHTDFEVVICENGGAQAFAELERILPKALASGQEVTAFQAPRNLGYAGGVNACLAAAPNADAWWVLNPDTEPTPQALARLVERLAAGGCEAVGSTVKLGDGRVQSFGGRWDGWLARPVSIGFGHASDEEPDVKEIERVQNYLNGASLLVSRRFLEEAGGMREDYFLYCEEVEWCLRALRRGCRLGFAPDAIVLHHQGTSMGGFGDVRRRPRLPVYLSERNKLLLTVDCYPARFGLVAAVSVALLLYRYGRRGAWRQILYALGGWWAGLRGERGIPAWVGA